MINKHKVILFFLVLMSMPCFAGGLKGNLIDEKIITTIIICIVLVHIFSIVAYVGRILWLRVVCGVLYLPVFLIPLVLSFFSPGFILAFIPPILFYYFMIGTRRK